MNSDVLLSVEAAAIDYGDLRAVWDVSFDVEAGRVTALFGRNGAGKTTVLRGISGLNAVAQGDVKFQGTSVLGLSAYERAHQGIAYVQEGKQIFRRRTVEENLLLGGIVLGEGRRVLKRRVQSAYERFPILADRRALQAGSLSGGQQQMLAISQALVAEPKVLLLDEPSGGLAPTIVEDVLSIVKDLKAEGLGILLVEQAVDAALRFSDRVVVIDIGRVVADFMAGSGKDMSLVKSAYLGRNISERPQA